MAILSKPCKPDNFYLHNSPKLSFTNIQGLRSNFANLSLNQTLLVFFLCVRQIWMTQLILAISLPLIWKDSSTHMHGIVVYVTKGLPFPSDLCLENSADYFLWFWLDFDWFCVLLLFPLSVIFFVFVYSFLILISSNTDEVLIHHKDWLTYFDGTDWPGVIIKWPQIISNDLTQMVNFPTQILDSDLIVLLLNLFLTSDASICSTMAPPHWEILIMLSQFPLTFHQIVNGMPHFIT